MQLTKIIERCQTLYDDLELTAVSDWKEAGTDRRAVGYLPTYVPREIMHAAGILPVGVLGAGDNLEIVKGDACFQSYICHLPRSVMELGLAGKLDVLDGMVFPSTCDVIRNLSGIWQLEFPGKYVRYLDVPQNFDPAVGGTFYRELLNELLTDMAALTGQKPEDCDLNASIRVYNQNRALVQELYQVRAEQPWLVPASEVYLLLRTGAVLPVEEHSVLVRQYLDAVQDSDRPMKDNARVVIAGAFCEQPPLTLLRTLERAGCDLIDDDLLLVMRWLGDEVDETGNGLDTLAQAYVEYQGESSCRYVPDDEHKGDRLVDCVRDKGAEGVIFAAPSFCDPALLDRPMLQARLTEEGISHTAFKYAENSGQMQPIREQAGTFADTIKLWGDA